MEPADLKPNAPDDAPLEAWLRANAQRPALPDYGFSARVLAALPPRAPAFAGPAAAWSLRGWSCAAAALLGVLIAASVDGSSSSALEQLAGLEHVLRDATVPLADSSTRLALVVTAVSLAFVYRRELKSKLR